MSQPAASARSMDAIALVAVFTTVLTWASSFAAIRVALVALTPTQLAASRYLLAAVVAGIYLVVTRPPVPSLDDFKRLFVIGVLFVSGYALFLNTGELTVKAGPASFILQVNPILVALLAIPLLGERFGPFSWCGTLLSFAGIGLIALGGEGHLTFDLGALFVFGSAACAAVSSIMQKPLLGRMPPLVVTAWVLFIGALPLLWAGDDSFAALAAAPTDVVASVVWLAVMPTLVGYATWAIALKRMPAGRASNFLYCVPVAATVIGYVWIGEVPSALALVGGAMALVGVVIVNLVRGR